MQDENPLVSVFSREDLANLEQGLDILGKPRADHRVSHMLTDESNRDIQSAIARWFEIAEQKGCREHILNRLRRSFRDWAACIQTVGELLAGCFLYENLDRQVQYRCGQRGADFSCRIGDSPAYCEAKTAVGGIPPGFDASDRLADFGIDAETGGFTLYSGPAVPATHSVRQLLHGGRKQLGEDDTNLILIVDWWRPGIDDYRLVEALYGQEVIVIPYCPSGPVGKSYVERQRDGACKPEPPQQMKRVSAVGVLRFVALDSGWRIHAWFVHNLYATKPIAPEFLEPWPQLEPTDDRRGLRWRGGINFKGLPAKT